MSPSSTRKGPTSSSLIIPADTTTPPPPCWCLSRSGALCPLLIQPGAHPSGPSKVTLISSVHKIFEKSVFRYFLAQSWRFNLCVLFSGGQVSAFLTLAMSLSTEHLVLLGTPGRLQFSNMTALEDNGFLVASRLNLLKSLAVNFSQHASCNPIDYLQQNVWWFCDHCDGNLEIQEAGNNKVIYMYFNRGFLQKCFNHT